MSTESAPSIHPNSLANLRPAWKEGETGNPKGRIGPNRSTLFRKWVEAGSLTGEGQIGDDIVKAAILKAMQGDIPAVKEVFDSAYGKITDKTELTGKDGEALTALAVSFAKTE